MQPSLLYAAAGIAVGAAVMHSLLGERRMIGPILEAAPPGPAVLRSSLSRRILRFAWHVTSLAWLAQAAVLAIVATFPSGAQGRPTVVVTGVSFLVIAAIAVAISRGRHVGWPLLAAVGVAALAGALM